jgi:hypothetical protein
MSQSDYEKELEDKINTAVQDILDDPVFENMDYVVGIFTAFDPQVMSGLYAVVNRDTLLIELTEAKLPTCMQYAVDASSAIRQVEKQKEAKENPSKIHVN